MRLDILSGLVKEETKELAIEPQIIKKEKSSSNTSAKPIKQLRDEINQRKQALRDVTRMQASSRIGLAKHVNRLSNYLYRHLHLKIKGKIVN